MNATTKALLTVPLVAAGVVLLGYQVFAHCQIPCGIYNDPARFTLLAERITTIEKSMKQIESLSKAEKLNHNQITRWVNNKESHADEFSEIVTYYFLAQRVKPAKADDAAYVNKVVLLHKMLVSAMKAKQTTDLAHVEALRKNLEAFKAAYLGKKGAEKKHDHKHLGGHKHAHAH